MKQVINSVLYVIQAHLKVHTYSNVNSVRVQQFSLLSMHPFFLKQKSPAYYKNKQVHSDNLFKLFANRCSLLLQLFIAKWEIRNTISSGLFCTLSTMDKSTRSRCNLYYCLCSANNFFLQQLICYILCTVMALKNPSN